MIKTIFTILFLMVVPWCVFAQEKPAGSGFAEFTQDEMDYINNLPSTELTDLVLEKEDYQPGEVIKGSFNIKNERNYGVPNLAYTISLTHTEGDYRSPVMDLDIYQAGNITLLPLETKEISFSYKLPDMVAGKDFGVRVQVLTNLGSHLSWGDAKVNIVGLNADLLEIKDPYIKVADKTMSLQEGPVIKKDRPAFLFMNINNQNQSENEFLLTAHIYKKTIAGEKFKEYEDVIMLKPGWNNNVSFAIETNDDPSGIYEGVLAISDTNGKTVSQKILFRYIVDGPVATIQSVIFNDVDVDHFSLERGDAFSVTLNYSGEVFDFFENTLSQQSDLKTSILLTDENGEKISTWEDDINFNEGLSKKIDLTALIGSEVMNVKIVVFDKNGGIITQYEDKIGGLTNDTKRADVMWKKLIKIITIAIIIAPVIALLLWFLKKRGYGVALFVLLFLPISGIFGIQYADARKATMIQPSYHGGCCYPTLTINTPTSTVCADEGFDITGSISFFVCSNAGTKVDMWSSKIVPSSSVRIGSWEGYWTTSKFVGGNNDYRSRDILIKRTDDGKYIAPSEPGSYRIYFLTQSWARSWDPGDAGRQNWYIDFNVEDCTPQCTGSKPLTAEVCPTDDVGLTENIEWARAVNDQCSNTRKCEYYFRTNGACNSAATGEYAWDATGFRGALCATGTPNLSRVDFPAYNSSVTWGCNGTGGGTSTTSDACSANRLAPPDCACSTNANTNYPYTATNPTLPLCTAGSPDPASVAFPVGQYGESSRVTWACINSAASPCTGTSPICAAQRIAPTVSCIQPTGEFNTKSLLPSTLCSSDGHVTSIANSPSSETPPPQFINGRWVWRCQHNVVANIFSEECSAPTCITGRPITATTPVIINRDNDQHTIVSVSCPNLCCNVVREGTTIPVTICTNGTSSAEIQIPAGGANLESMCWFDDGDGEPGDPGDTPETRVNTVAVQTACTARSCNTQHTCQATAQIADSLDDCSSTCNSDSDCSSGRMIETRP